MQRVKSAAVDIVGGNGKFRSGEIPLGLVVLLAVENGDTQTDASWMALKISRLRIFDDDKDRMNVSLMDSGGDVLVLSQFTLFGSLRKGSRPSFNRSAKNEISGHLYEHFCSLLECEIGKTVQRGIFGAHMELTLVNDGPVTIILDSRNKDL